MSVNHPHTGSDRNAGIAHRNSHLYIVKDRGEISNWKNEAIHWLSPINACMCLWQPVKLRNYFFTRHQFFKTAFTLPHFNLLWKNICKGSFAYNTFLFHRPAFSRNYNHTFLADLTCLALLFGDEFIDGACAKAGKLKVLELLKENGNKFYLHINTSGSGYPQLEYSFDLYKLIPSDVWMARNEKYNITYTEFYELLKSLLHLINERLGKMKRSTAAKAALKIKEACDFCFDTFIHDVNDAPVQTYHQGMSFPTACHSKKSRALQLKLLELRCLLVNRSINYFEKTFQGWLDITSSVQIYDDMQDCRVDDHFQDNVLLAFAAGNFPGELEWFHKNKKKGCNDGQWRMQVSLYMPCATYLCTKITKDKMTENMSWTQKKICNYLWRNNWYDPSEHVEKRTETGNIHRLNEIIEETFPVFELTGSETEWKAYAFEIAFHDIQLKKYILSKTSWLTRYFLLSNFMQMSSFEKTRLLKRIIPPNFHEASK